MISPQSEGLDQSRSDDGGLVLRRGNWPINPFDPDLPDPDTRRDARAAVYHRARLSESTRRKYRYFAELYLDFCATTGRVEVPGNAFTLEAFAVWLAQRPVRKGKNAGKTGLAPASILLALSAVRALHEAAGENPPVTRLARGIVEGHEEMRKEDPTIHDGQGSPAVDLPTFAELVAACPADTSAGLRDRALLTLGLQIMARRMELCILTVPNVTKFGDGWIKVRIRRTKGGKPREPKVPPWDHLPELCAVRAVTAWIKRMGELGIPEGPLFRAVDSQDVVRGTPGGKWAGKGTDPHGRIDPVTVELIIARAAYRASVPNADELKPHGVLRASGATMAYNAGADILAIARQGGWHERSPVIFRYIRDVDEVKRNPMLLIGRDGPQ